MEELKGEKLEFETLDCLWRAFIRDGADYVVIDGWSGAFLRTTTNHAVSRGWLRQDPSIKGDSQYTCIGYRLTDLGRKVLGKHKRRGN